MSALSKCTGLWLILSKVDCHLLLILLVLSLAVVGALCIDVVVGQMLATEGTNHFVLFKFASVSINKLGPFVHLVSGLFIELLLIKVVLFL